MNLHLSLNEILDINKFQNLQDNLSKAIEMAILTVNYKGVPVTRHSGCHQFCSKVRALEPYSDLCQKCDSRGGLEAARTQKPYVYICHMGIVDIAVPIIHKNQYLGAILAGQTRTYEIEALEHVVSPKMMTNYQMLDTSIIQAYNKLPLMDNERINAIGDTLFDLSNILVEKAILSTYKNRDDDNKLLLEDLKDENYYEQPFTNHVQFIPQNRQYSFLNVAVEYIDAHLYEKIYLSDIAKACNLSESYFSKCFKKEFGMSFKAYHMQQKISESEELLKATNKNVNQIADELGFENASYFIKLFKNRTGMTPASYKNKMLKTRVK